MGQEKNTIEIRGEVKDSVSHKPRAFVSVKIKGKAIGVATNNEGNFSLRLPSQIANDSLTFSLIGYTSKIVAVKDLVINNNQTFFLNESPTPLQEVVIKAPNVERIVQEVAKRLKYTFPTAPFEFDGYYRNSYKEFDTYVRQFEAAFRGY